MANRRVDSLKAKQKKQKIVAAVLGVLFIGVLGFQGPRLWKQLHPATAPARPSYNETSTTAGTPSLAAPTLGGSEAPASTSSTDTSLAPSAPPVADGQLSSFSLFASKDPFAQQLSDGPPASSSSGSSAGGSAGRSARAGSSGGGESSSSSSSSPSSSSPSSSGSASAPTPG